MHLKEDSKMKKTTTSKLFLIAAASMTAMSLSFTPVSAEETALPTADRAGNEITVPEEITKIVCMAPSTAQVLEDLGLTDLLVGIDNQTPYYVEGLDALPQFDMMAPDCESLLALDPDIVFTTCMSNIGSDGPYAELVAAGICVAEIPSSASIEAIQTDIQFISDCFGMHQEGAALVEEMQSSIDTVSAIGETITDKKSVLFEIACLPDIYSFGSGCFLNEMLELIGAENVFADQEGWMSVTEEAAIAANPDVILTSVNYIEDPVGEILSRQGWENVTAISNQQAYYIDNASTALPNHRIVTALEQMAAAVYPEVYTSLEK